jgi:hypothetical protein
VSYGDKFNPPVCAVDCIAQGSKVRSLNFIRYYHHPHSIVRNCTVDKFKEAHIASLVYVNHGRCPRSVTADLQRKPSLSNTRRAVDVQLLHRTGFELECQALASDLFVHRVRRLPRYTMYFSV